MQMYNIYILTRHHITNHHGLISLTINLYSLVRWKEKMSVVPV